MAMFQYCPIYVCHVPEVQKHNHVACGVYNSNPIYSNQRKHERKAEHSGLGHLAAQF